MSENRALKRIGTTAAGIYVFLIFVTSDNMMLLVASLVLFIGFLSMNLRKGRLRIKTSPYFLLELAFIAYCILQIVLNVAVLRDVSASTIRRLIINCADEFMLYNILIRLEDTEDVLNVLIYPYLAGLVLLILLQMRFGTLFSLRLTTSARAEVTYRFLGMTINAGAATLIAHCAVCAFAFSLICSCANKKKKHLLLAAVAFFALLLTSSRKALVIALLMIVVIPEIQTPNRKRIQYILGAICMLVVFWIAIMKIPELYNLIGIRFERMIAVFRTGNMVDTSINTRDGLKEMAWNAFMERPMEGWGVNAFKELFNGGRLYSHNNYLEIMVGTGILGTMIYLSRYAYLFARLLRGLKSWQPQERYYIKTLLFWLCAVMTMEYWQVAYYNERMIVHYVFALAVIDTVVHRQGKKLDRKRS